MAYQWTPCGYSGGGHYPTIHPDVSLADTWWLTSDVAGIWKSTDNGDTWTFKNTGMERVNLGCFRQNPTNRLIMFAGANGNGGSAYASGIERSVDGGETWTHLTGTSSLYQFPRSINSSNTIAIVPGYSSVSNMHVYFGSANGKVYKSIDGGTTITEYATPFGGTKPSSLWVNNAGTYLFVGSPNNGIMRYNLTTGVGDLISLVGTNALRNRDIGEFTINGLRYIYVAAGWKIAYTTDDGASWSYTSALSSDPTKAVGRVSAVPSIGATGINNVRFFCTVNNTSNNDGTNFAKSTDGGLNWDTLEGNVNYNTTDSPTRIWNFGQSYKYVTSVAYDPRNPDRIMTASNWAAMRSDDHGANWYEKVKGALNAIGTDVVIAPDNSIILTAMDNGVFRSTDGGTNWKMCIPNNSGGQAYPQVAGHCWRVVCLGTEAEWLAGTGVCIATNFPWDGSTKNQILRSTNMGGAQGNGGTWSILLEATTGIPNADMNYNPTYISSGSGQIRGMCKDSSNRIAISLDGWNGVSQYGGIFVSGTNGQMPFTRKTVITGTTDFWKCNHGIAVDPTDPDKAVIVTWNSSTGIRYTANFTSASPTWSAPASGNQFFLFDVVCSANGIFYASGNNSSLSRVYRSVDGGANWTQIYSGSAAEEQADGMCLHPSDPLILFFSTTADYGIGPQKVYMTSDAEAGSVSWTDITGDLVAGPGFTRLAVRLNGNGDINSTDGYLYGSRYAGTLWKLNLDSAAAPGTGVLTSTSVVPASLVQSAVSTVTVGFTTENAWPDNGKLQIEFPTSLGSGFAFNQGGTSAAAFTVGGDGTLSVSIASNIVTLTRSGGTQINAATAVALTLTFVMNPDSVGSTGVFKLYTRTTADALIDSDTAVAAVTITPSPATYQALTFENVTLENIIVNG